jgi:hypothetical protein
MNYEQRMMLEQQQTLNDTAVSQDEMKKIFSEEITPNIVLISAEAIQGKYTTLYAAFDRIGQRICMKGATNQAAAMLKQYWYVGAGVVGLIAFLLFKVYFKKGRR